MKLECGQTSSQWTREPPITTLTFLVLRLTLRLLDARPQEIQRLIDLRHPSKIDTIAEALKALGKRLNLTLARS